MGEDEVVPRRVASEHAGACQRQVLEVQALGIGPDLARIKVGRLGIGERLRGAGFETGREVVRGQPPTFAVGGAKQVADERGWERDAQDVHNSTAARRVEEGVRSCFLHD